MEKFGFGKILGVVLLLGVIYLATTSIDTGYLNNSKYGSQLDTIGSASTNDTSWTFPNTANWDILRVEYTQNSVTSTFRVFYPGINNLRLRYVASDSTVFAEVSGVSAPLNWVRAPILINSSSTSQDKFQIPLRTGNFIFSVRGEKN